LYYKWRRTIDDLDDQGLMVLLVLLQSKFKFDFNVPYKAYGIKESISKIYKNIPENTLKNEVFGRNYLYDAYKNEIDAETVMKSLRNMEISVENGYEITHHVLAIMFLGDEYKNQMINILLKLINILKFSDLKTESIYFLFLLDPHVIKQRWIDEIIINQEDDGSLFCDDYGEYKDATAHHTGLGLILYMSYRKYKRKEQMKKCIFVILMVIISICMMKFIYR